jgi:hypothetical protein
MSLKSEIKVGSQFEFSIQGEKGIRQKAVVTKFLSNREEGLGPEADFTSPIGWKQGRSRNRRKHCASIRQPTETFIWMKSRLTWCLMNHQELT